MGEFPQLVEILFDASLSMNDPFTVEEETSLSGSRMGMAKSFVEIFVSSISKTKIRYGLTTFNTRVQTKVKVTDPPSDIRSVLRDIRANGHTKCFAAMSSVAKTMCSATEQIKRMIVISDGIDNKSDWATIAALPELLITNRIRVDAIILTNNQEEIENRLVAIARWTGGVAFHPNTADDLDALAENEIFFDATNRKFDGFHSFPISENMISACPTVAINELDTEVQKLDVGTDASDRLVGGSEISKIVERKKSASLPERTMYILSELADVDSKCEDVHVYAHSQKIDVWEVFIKGSEDTEYGPGWWHIHVDFPRRYPEEAPLLRFLSGVPFHPNISKWGRIGLSCLGEKYKQGVSMASILADVVQLLKHPDHEHPLETFTSELYKTDPEYYRKMVVSSTVSGTRESVGEWLKELSP